MLPNGQVLFAGGYGYADIYMTTHSSLVRADLYNVGLGFSSAWQPQIAAVASPITTNECLTLAGSQFRGVSEGSSGNTQDSPADCPVVQLRRLDNEQTLFVLSTNWSTNSFISVPINGFPPGYAMATVFVNGIPSTGSILKMFVPDFSYTINNSTITITGYR
ncbi:MAG: hypothetical protein NT154_19610 [Verrucomicrobia bacterium]|nr:hypothetical protein [Verrucomicrobiota bacterium]